MRTNFDKAMEFVAKWEGGLSNHPSDRGGLTNRGITQGTYDTWRARRGLPRRLVSEATHQEITNIYKFDYWNACQCERLPLRIAITTFDSAVNCGPGRAKLWLQGALDVETDGSIGPITLAAAGSSNDLGVSLRMISFRSDFYMRLIDGDDSQRVFKKGWMNRLADLARFVIAGV